MGTYRAAEMIEKCKDHWQAQEHDDHSQAETYKWKASGLLCDLVPEATVFRVRCSTLVLVDVLACIGTFIGSLV